MDIDDMLPDNLIQIRIFDEGFPRAVSCFDHNSINNTNLTIFLLFHHSERICSQFEMILPLENLLAIVYFRYAHRNSLKQSTYSDFIL